MQMEQILFALDGLRRYWYLFLLPLIAAAPLAFLVWKMAPMKYEATSNILMLSANRGPESAGGFAGFPRQSAIEQVAVLEAWLKSDYVLRDLLPQLLDEPVPTDPEVLAIVTNVLRRSLTMQLIGAAVLEVRLEGAQAKGLGRKLEIIVTRLLEGVINPEAGILSANQLIVARRGEAVAEAEMALDRAISVAKLGALEAVKAQLQSLQTQKHELTQRSGSRTSTLPVGQPAGQPASGEQAVAAGLQQLDEARAAISSDPTVVKTLERLFEAYEDARLSHQDARERAGTSLNSYVRVFDAPERLTVIGRPRDPASGVSSGKKLAIAVMLLGFLGGLGLVGLAVFLDPRLRIGEAFEFAAGVPVVTRLAKAHRAR